jgi:sortase A
MRRYLRSAAALLAAAALALLLWSAVTLVWGEPFTAIGASRAQAALRKELVQETDAWRSGDSLRSRKTLRHRAARFRAGLREGDAVGRLVVPKLGLRTVVVEGTRADDLARGPGHYRITSLPGQGGTVAIAGHRTTYLQPFRHVDQLRPGNGIRVDLPYGSFRYVVYRRAIVDDRDWSILRRQRFESLVLSACHPLHSAAQRIVVFARLSGSSPRG